MGASVMTMPEAKLAVQLYAEGYSQPEIAQRLNRSRSAVRTALRQMGVQTRTPAEGLRAWIKRQQSASPDALAA